MNIGRRLLISTAGILLAFCAFALPADAHPQTLGLFRNDPGSFNGYTLFAPNSYPATYLIDNEGRLVQSWSTGGGTSAYLLEDGSLIRASIIGFNPVFTAGGGTGMVRKFDWDGNLTWEYAYSSSTVHAHHDIEVLPNGNVLILAWEYRSGAEAIAAGRDPALLRDGQLWPEQIVEVQPTGPTTGDIVWEWHSWDHLVQDFDASKANYGVVGDHPELIDMNYFDAIRPATGEADWHHANGLDYNAALDQIAISVRHFSEFWIIDHSTSSAEAAGHAGGTSGKGGDLLYRWGNPQAYDAGDATDQQLFLQHNAVWVPAGYPGEANITVFNNGLGRPGVEYSSVEEIDTPVDQFGNYSLTPGEAYGPTVPYWSYSAPNPTDFYSSIISGAQRLPNGNTLIDDGTHGAFFEVEPDGTEVWRYVNPVVPFGPAPQGFVPSGSPAQNNAAFRVLRYAPTHPGLTGRDLTPGAPLELYPDADGDGLLDDEELKIYGTNPGLADTDGDHLSDGQEVNVYSTNPLVVDTDGGGSPDGLDALLGDPLDPGDDASQMPFDTDGDGCTNGAELGTDSGTGGNRDPLNTWDFFDVDGNGVVDLFGDIFGVADRFGANDAGGTAAINRLSDLSTPVPPAPAYHPAFDRGAIGVGQPWSSAAPDGSIDLFEDIFNAAYQFGHDCTGGP